jgi:Tfp pilus assembly protein PilF
MLVAAAAMLSACEQTASTDEKPPSPINAIDESNLSEIMLTAANPADAAEYFRRSLAEQPDRVDFKRGYAISLVRSKQFPEASIAYRSLIETGQATANDRIEYAHVLARFDDWDGVEQQVNAVPIGSYTARYRLIEAMLADHRQDWATADAAYDAARLLSTEPAKVLNNWGVSRMARGELKEAERTFEQAILFDPTLFQAKNNLALAYGLQRQYRLPIVSMNEEEKAVVLHNLAVLAIRQGDENVARGLLTQAVAVHPRHFAAASDKLAAMEAVVEN